MSWPSAHLWPSASNLRFSAIREQGTYDLLAVDRGADTGVEMSITLCRAKTFAVLVILGMLLMPVPVALANAAPPLELWLDFEYQTSEQPDLEGVQIIGCDTPECNQPRLLQQYGRCDSGDCLDSPPSLQTVQDLQCVEERCVAVFHNRDDGAYPLPSRSWANSQTAYVRAICFRTSYPCIMTLLFGG